MKRLELSEILGLPQLDAWLDGVEGLLITEAQAAPPPLRRPLVRLTGAGGKRLRAALVLAAGVGPGGPSEQITKAAAAIELVHLGTLIHDDLIDGAATRRGAPTVSAQEGASLAVLAGDYVLARAGILAAQVEADAAELIAATVAAMSIGQSRELADGHRVDRTAADYYAAVTGKTAALLTAAARIGGLCAGLQTPQLEALGEYGRNFGLSLQLADDVLDIIGAAGELGKPTGADLAAGVYTLPVILAFDGPYASTVRSWLGHHPATRPSPERVMATLTAAGTLEQTMAEAYRLAAAASQTLATMAESPAVAGLRRLPAAYVQAMVPHLPAR